MWCVVFVRLEIRRQMKMVVVYGQGPPVSGFIRFLAPSRPRLHGSGEVHLNNLHERFQVTKEVYQAAKSCRLGKC